MGLGQTVRGLSGGVLPAALGHLTRRIGPTTDLVGTVPFDVNLFRITGGPILVTSFYGKVTATIGAGASILQLQHTPTSTGAQENLCAVIGAGINTDAIDTMYVITGAPGAPMVVSDQVGVCDASMSTNLLILVPGIINMEVTVAQSTGRIDWTLHWIPLDFDSRVAVL
jgi:hypothetical protein